MKQIKVFTMDIYNSRWALEECCSEASIKSVQKAVKNAAEEQTL